jgi:repressor LexA
MLTTKQEKVLNSITEFISRYGKSPTIEELKNILEQKSKRWVVQYLESLERKGFITRGRGFRSIRLWNWVGFQQMMSIPILWYANAGRPLVNAQEDNLWVLPVSKSIIKGDEKNYFMLKIEGTSMNQYSVNGKIIENGSYVLINGKDNNPNLTNSKDAYLFIVNDSATIKIPRKEADNLYLLPKSSDSYHQPIVLSSDDDVKISWKIIDVYNFTTLEDED